MKWVDMVPAEWFEDSNTSTFWLRIYTTLLVPQNKIQERFKDIVCSYVVDSQPIKLSVLGLSDGFKLPVLKNSFVYSHPDDGSMIVPVKIKNISFPKSTYVFLFTPYKINNVNGDENKTKSNLDQLEAILSARLGSNTLHSLIYEGELPLTDACQAKTLGQAVPVLNQCDGPFLDKDNWESSLKLVEATDALSKGDKQNRIRLALQYYQKGKNTFRSEEKFFFYWTAITIVTGDTATKAINKNLQYIYSENKSYVDDKLAWKWAIECRNDFFKRGIRLNFHANIERYFQLLFLDLLEHELGLETDKHLLSYIALVPDWNRN